VAARKNIVFVVGAGASHGFEPEMGTGSYLFDNIRKRLDEEKEKGYLTNILDGLERFDQPITQQDRTSFLQELDEYKKSQSEKELTCSIDDFLEKNKGNERFRTIGTFAIAFHVLGYEGACLGKASFDKSSWLHEVNDFIVKYRLNTWSDRFVDLKIVTFNYDRLIEEFLYRKHGQAIGDFMKNSLVHVYEKVSPLPWQTHEMKSNEDFLVFGHPNDDVKRILDNRKNILLMYGQRAKENPCLYQAKAFIASANTVLFLGYGYDDANNKNLGLSNLKTKNFIANYFVPEWNDAWKKKFEDFKKDHKMWNKEKNQSIYTTETCTDFIRHWLNRSVEL
jgi:hypothetical protein